MLTQHCRQQSKNLSCRELAGVSKVLCKKSRIRRERDVGLNQSILQVRPLKNLITVPESPFKKTICQDL